MAARLYLIILAGLMLAQGLSLGLTLYERYESTTAAMLNTVEHDVATSVAVLDRLPAAERPQWLGRLRRDNYQYLLGAGTPGFPLISERSHEVVRRIANEVGPAFHVTAQAVSREPERYQVHFTLSDGAALTLEVTPRLMPVAAWLPLVLVLQVATLLLCAWLAVRLATRHRSRAWHRRRMR